MVLLLVCLLIAYLFVDTVSRGNVHSSIKGGAKGAAIHSARRGAATAKGARVKHRERLASGDAFLGKTRLKVGDAARGAVAGPVKVLAVGARDGARDERDRRRARARGEDLPTPRIPEPRMPWQRKRTDTTAPSVPSVNAPSVPSVPTPTPTPTAPTPRTATPPPPAATATGDTTTTGGTPMSASTIGVNVETVPGLVSAVAQWSAAGRQIIESATALGVTGPVIAQFRSAVELSGVAVQEIRAQMTPLIEAASGVQGADTVTVAAARQV